MTTNPAVSQTIDEYIASCPEPVHGLLQQIRTAIKNAAPEAEESISYKMPTFSLHGKYLIYFSAHKKHIGLYPAPIEHPEFKAELSAYATGKGTVQFPLDKPMPLELIGKIVRFRAQENLAKGKKP